MFARHTQTRMKGSAVVQGLKSWASKFHPQLPLSAKESQRLLTALTSSFRYQLDEAHRRPGGNIDGVPKPKDRNVAGNSSHSLHYSAAHYADRHLAGVLTSPLLSKPDGGKKPYLDYTSAKLELHRNSAKDPILVLEEYQEQNAATVPIAALCLETFQRSADGMSPEKRQKAVSDTEAGKRTLLWLWKTKLYDTVAFVDDMRLMTIMVPFVIEEGFEEYLWQWLEKDTQLGVQNLSFEPHEVERKLKYQYRWKGRVLRNIIDAKLRWDKNKSADCALDAFFRACHIRKPAMSKKGSNWPDASAPPINAAGILLSQTMMKTVYAKNTDAARYDNFIESCSLFLHDPTFLAHERAQLKLKHPKTPSPLPFLEWLKSGEAPNASKRQGELLDFYRKPRHDKERRFFFNVMTDAIALLRDGGLTADAKWLTSRAIQWFSATAQHIEADMRRKQKMELSMQEDQFTDRAPSRAPVPFPSFV